MVQRFAQFFGVIYIIVGVLGFVPGATQMVPAYGIYGGLIFGLFPVNAVHDLLHVLLGGWGLLASRTAASSQAYSRWLAFLLALLGVLGLIPGTADLFGLAPIGSPDTWLHFASAILAAYFGWAVAKPSTASA